MSFEKELPKLPKFEDHKYAIHSAFLTIQGEGYWTGRRAVFIRFSGCNIWSGLEKDRERDSAKGCCARICDTNFFGTNKLLRGGKHSVADIVRIVEDLWGEKPGEYNNRRFVVLTGGEPSLQVDSQLLLALKDIGCFVTMETNGSIPLPLGLDWVTLSPKPPMPVHPDNVHRFSEVKVLSIFDPFEFEDYAYHHYVQPVDFGDPKLNKKEMEKCLNFVLKNPSWSLSAQLHKTIGVP